MYHWQKITIFQKPQTQSLLQFIFSQIHRKKSSPNLNVYWSEVNPTSKSGKKFSSISLLSKVCKNLSTQFLRKLRITSTVTQKVVSTSLMHLEKDFLNKKALRNSLLLLVVLLLMNTTQRKNLITSEWLMVPLKLWKNLLPNKRIKRVQYHC